MAPFQKKLFQQFTIDINWLVTTRLLIAGVLLLTVHFFVKDHSQIWGVWKNRRRAFQLIVFGLVGMLSVQYTYMASIKTGNAAVATLLQYLAPIMIIIYLILRKHMVLTRKDLSAIILALAGCFFLINKRLHFTTIRAENRNNLGAFIGNSDGFLYLVRNSSFEAIRFPRHCWLGYDHRRFRIKFYPSTLAYRL